MIAPTRTALQEQQSMFLILHFSFIFVFKKKFFQSSLDCEIECQLLRTLLDFLHVNVQETKKQVHLTYPSDEEFLAMIGHALRSVGMTIR